MKKYKTIIVAVIVIVAALAVAWFLGGTGDINPPEPQVAATPTEYELLEDDTEPEPISAATEELIEEEPIENEEIDEPVAESEEVLPEEPVANDPPAEETEIPPPVESGYVAVEDDFFTVTLEVRVDMLVANMHLLHSDKHELVPEDGVIFLRTAVTAYEGESVFNVLQREMRRNRIHMSSRFTPVLNSAYLEAIGNLYEQDAGALSGWVYSVNGWFPNFGSSRYLLNPGDEIEWHFTLDLGRDVGMDPDAGGQLDD